MKKKIILFLICMLLISFGLGVFTGYGKLIPDSVMNDFGLKQPKIHQNPYMNLKNYPLIPIHVNDSEDISKLRSDLIHYIWKEQSFENLKSLTKIEENIIDTNYDDLENLKQIDKFLISMDLGINSTSYLFLPHDSNNELILYHQGHRGDFYNGKNTIEYFLKNGYSVLAFSMPLLGMNNQPLVDTEFGQMKLMTHDYFSFIESPNFSPMKFYFEPIILSLNSVEENFNFDNFYMVGISGGGWTTTIYSAIDQRISKSFSIAGSIPISLRTSENDLGDYEQTLPDFYKIANYLDLYVLASYGDNRKHVQIFNKYDPCCFSGNLFKNYENQIEITVLQLGKGSFQIYLDDTHYEHKISENALDIIIKEMGE